MNIKFDHTSHKKLWNWLAENPDKEKRDWPEWKENGGEIKRATSLCFACDYVEHNCLSCCECPLDWPFQKDLMKICSQSLFGVWTRHSKDSAEVALQIANLPVKDGVETI